MSLYREIRQWLYLNLETGVAYFNLSYSLAIINGTPESTLFPQRETKALSLNRLRSIINKAGAQITPIPSNEISFIKGSSGEPIDTYSANLNDNLEVLSSTELSKVLKFESSREYHKQTSEEYTYVYQTLGEILRKSDHKLFISVDRSLYDIEGRGYPVGNMTKPYKPLTMPSPRVFRAKAQALANNGDIIKVSPKEIDFDGRQNRPKNPELYLSRELHDKLFNYYVSNQKYDLASRTKSLTDLIDSFPSLDGHSSRKRLKRVMDIYEEDAYNKMVKRTLNKIVDLYQQQITQVWDSESHIRHELIDTQRRLAKIREIVDSDDSLTFNQISEIKYLTNQY